MTMTLSKDFKFDSAHNLVKYKGKCENLHGHTYRLKVTVTGNPDPDSGMIVDFTDIKRIVREKVIDRLDHAYLNDLIPQSTAENIVRWIWNELEKPLAGPNSRLTELTLWETESSSVTLRRE